MSERQRPDPMNPGYFWHLTICYHILWVICFCLVSTPNTFKFLKARQCFLIVNGQNSTPSSLTCLVWELINLLPASFSKLKAVVFQLETRLESLIRYLLIVWPWAGYLTSLCCSLLIGKVGLLLPSLRISVKIKWDSTKKALNKCCHELLLKFFSGKNVTWQMWIPGPAPQRFNSVGLG